VATVILLDTHVVAWLHAGDTKRFPASARKLLDSEQLAVSPVVRLELAYLREIGRIATADERLRAHLPPAVW
jgi:PIN domain nuclease of toxin-antitoxin system